MTDSEHVIRDDDYGDDTLNTFDAAREAGVTVQQLRRWGAAGYLRPSKVDGAGRGAQRWSAREVDKAEQLGAFAHTLCADGALGVVAARLDDGPSFVCHDGVYAITVTIAPDAARSVPFDMHRYFRDKSNGRA